MLGRTNFGRAVVLLQEQGRNPEYDDMECWVRVISKVTRTPAYGTSDRRCGFYRDDPVPRSAVTRRFRDWRDKIAYRIEALHSSRYLPREVDFDAAGIDGFVWQNICTCEEMSTFIAETNSDRWVR